MNGRELLDAEHMKYEPIPGEHVRQENTRRGDIQLI